MAVKSMVPLGDTSLRATLASVDADRMPMPKTFMKGISAICGQASGMLKAAARGMSSAGLGTMVSGAPAMFPAAKSVSRENSAALAAVAALGAVAALSGGKKSGAASGKDGEGAKTAKAGDAPSPEPTKTPSESPKVDEKKPAPTGPVTISLSGDAAKKLPINPENIDTSTGKVKVTPTPTSIKGIPVKEGETEKKGFEMIDYGGKKYWVSTADKTTYAAWNKAYATSGGLKSGDTTTTPIETPAPKPKPVVAASPTTVEKPASDTKGPKPIGAPVAPKPGTVGAIATLAGGSDLAVEKPKGAPPPPMPTPKPTPDAGPDSSTGTPVVTSADAGVVGTPGDASVGDATSGTSSDTGASDSASTG